jgi:hypothetical protein
LGDSVETARKNGFKLTSHAFYNKKAHASLASMRKAVLLFKQEFSGGTTEAITEQISALEALVGMVDLDSDSSTLLEQLKAVAFHVDSDLAAAVESKRAHPTSHGPFFLPVDIVPNGTYRRVLEEVNRCFESQCYNACSAMLRRLIESLIIEAFEGQKIEAKILCDGEYLELRALIGKATTELKLGRNTRDALPKLKFFGDLSVHSRRNLVRKDDLARIHGEIRVALEELATYIP